MNDPPRLLSGDADERELGLLRAAAAEEPSADALLRLQQTLGLSVDLAPLSVPRAPTPARTGALDALGTPGHTGSLVASKWLLLSTAGVALVGALVWNRLAVPERTERSTASSSPSTSEPATPQPSAPAPSVPASTGPTQPASDATLDAPALRDELARLERARTLLRDRRARAALTTLDDYDRTHPHGTLREEAQALRIETLFALSEVPRASDLAQRFLRSYPHSVHGARVSSQLEQHGAR